MLAESPPVSAPLTSSRRGCSASLPQSRSASARLRAAGSPLRFRLVAVIGPTRSARRRRASAAASGCAEQRTPTAPSARATPCAKRSRQRSTSVRGPGQKRPASRLALGPGSNPSRGRSSISSIRIASGSPGSRPFQRCRRATAASEVASAPSPQTRLGRVGEQSSAAQPARGVAERVRDHGRSRALRCRAAGACPRSGSDPRRRRPARAPRPASPRAP